MSFSGFSVLVTVVALSSWISLGTEGYMIGDNPNHRAAYVDSQGMYYLEWQVDWNRNQITFTVIAGTTGYVLFGLANNASTTTGGDFIVAGVSPDGQPYFTDRYTLGNEVPREDGTSQDDYVLVSASENRTHTTLTFTRNLDTCDRFDYPITENKVSVIWGYGVSDDYETVRSYGVQGAYSVYLLDPDYSPRISRDRRLNGAPAVVTRDNLQLWTIRRQIVIPENTTSYICSIHKAPRLQRKHHMVGYDVYFHSQGSRRRTHHVLMYKCNAPGGGDPRPLFEPFEGGQGQACYNPARPPTAGPMPTHLCAELWAGWAIGGRAFFTPPHVGYPLGEESHEYYMVQTHYDNPEGRRGVVVDMRLDFFYTSFLRPNEGGMMGSGHDNPALPPSIILPPGTSGQRIFAHCPAECTRRMLPQSGIKVFAGLLHSHNSGRRLRLRHFGDGQEQPWVLHDDNYDNNFQQARHFREEVKILPGDQLTMECIYDNTWTNGSVVGGYTTRQEMCIAFVYYYSRISDYSYCRSEIVSEEYRRRFLGVSNVTWSEELLDWVAVTPPHLAGLTITEISDNNVDWDAGRREELMRFHEAHPHVSRCSRDLSYRDPEQVEQLTESGAGELTGSPETNVNTPDDYAGPGLYPFRARPYIPEQSCSYNEVK